MEKNINIIFQGGGIKGLSYVGVLRYLEENNYKIKYIAGTSVGAIIGSLVAVGYDSYDLENIINQINEDVFLYKKKGNNIIKDKGLYSLDRLEILLEKLFLDKGKRVFGDIKVGNNYKIIMISTSLNFKRIFVLPHDLKLININPDTFPIAKAVIMSASIPLFYEPVKINKYTFYDGGMSDNFPKWCFKKAIAFKVSKEKSYLTKLRTKIFGEINNKNIVDEIYINTNFVSSKDFKKGLKYKFELYNSGYYATKKFFEKLKLL